MAAPHYVRFAQAIALVGLAGGCGTATTVETRDATITYDTHVDCTTCTCGDSIEDANLPDSGLPMCPGIRIILCGCAAVGPLAPPDLA